MNDCNGNQVAVGDTVAYILGAANSPSLKVGTVTKIYPNGHKCSVDGHPNIYGRRTLLQEPQRDEVEDAVRTLKTYCIHTSCMNCRLKYALRCDMGKPIIPSEWEPEEILSIDH